MVANAVPLGLTTVLAGDGDSIHLAAAPEASSALVTMCRRPISGRISAQSFHRLGCPRCAQAAVSSGVTSIADHQGATVSLPRFLAAQRRSGSS